MSKTIIPANYTPALNLYDTQRAIGTVKRLFADTLCATLNLYRVSAPLFLEASTGLNDDLNGVERKVTFDIKESGIEAQVVQSLAKWKRKALKDYDFRVGKGLYCDMNAIRRDEDLDNLHSIYVDQWDWEKVIRLEDRNEAYLKSVVRSIVSAVCATEMNLHAMFPQLQEPRHGHAVTGKRHPTVGDNATIYSGASILGGKTVIGANSVIGGNSFITESVAPNTKASTETPRMIFRVAQPKPGDEK